MTAKDNPIEPINDVITRQRNDIIERITSLEAKLNNRNKRILRLSKQVNALVDSNLVSAIIMLIRLRRTLKTRKK